MWYLEVHHKTCTSYKKGKFIWKSTPIWKRNQWAAMIIDHISIRGITLHRMMVCNASYYDLVSSYHCNDGVQCALLWSGLIISLQWWCAMRPIMIWSHHIIAMMVCNAPYYDLVSSYHCNNPVLYTTRLTATKVEHRSHLEPMIDTSGTFY